MTPYVPPSGDPMAVILAAAEAGMHLGMEHVLTQSNQKVPVAEGTLMRSGIASTAVEGTEVQGAVSYATPYAVAQHEGVEFEHKNGRQAKYLESTATSEGSTVVKIITQSVKAAIGGAS